jgi:hypothetical protein
MLTSLNGWYHYIEWNSSLNVKYKNNCGERQLEMLLPKRELDVLA